MEKSFRFYKCKHCGENLFTITKYNNNQIVIFDECAIYYKSIICSHCRKEIAQLEQSYNPKIHKLWFIKLINEFLTNNENIDEELKKILNEFLKQKIYSRLKKINS